MGLRASAAEARGALAAARAARRPAGVAAHDAVGIRRMLMEWYASDTVRASVRDQLAPLEKLGRLAPTPRSGRSPPTWTSRGRWSRRRSGCTCTATR